MMHYIYALHLLGHRVLSVAIKIRENKNLNLYTQDQLLLLSQAQQFQKERWLEGFVHPSLHPATYHEGSWRFVQHFCISTDNLGTRVYKNCIIYSKGLFGRAPALAPPTPALTLLIEQLF
uniref:Uncharacterized protein n=1 Tax=Arundo donax TaxID=35708 RepID=A0A0A9DM23_ARUDO